MAAAPEPAAPLYLEVAGKPFLAVAVWSVPTGADAPTSTKDGATDGETRTSVTPPPRRGNLGLWIGPN